MKHHKARYGEALPVWIVMEIIDFGSVTHLFKFLPVATKNTIARNYGVTQGTVCLDHVFSNGVVGFE